VLFGHFAHFVLLLSDDVLFLLAAFHPVGDLFLLVLYFDFHVFLFLVVVFQLFLVVVNFLVLFEDLLLTLTDLLVHAFNLVLLLDDLFLEFPVEFGGFV
jgi:hypothetical protein